MPAVSVCDPIAARLHCALNGSPSKTSDDLSLELVSNASRIMQTEIRYEELKDFQATSQVQANCNIFLNLSPSENLDGSKAKDGVGYKKKNDPNKGLVLPEPAVTLYSPKKVHLGWKGTCPVGAGMYNVGNTCYLNSTLQALFHVPALVNWLLSDPHHNSKCEQNILDGGGECLTCAVAKTLQFSHQKSGGAIKPFYIYNKLKLICRTMVPGQQEDAHEFLRYLLEGMERAYLTRHKATKLDNYSKETTPINQIFGGYIRTEVKCLQCQHVSTTFQHFQDLLVDIRKANTLDEALNSYFSREQLDNNDYKCEACKRRVPATKQFTLERPPKVLCVQLKRFSFLGGKISRHIGFKQTIDMGQYLWREPGESPKQLTYKLMSMVTHMGPSVNCGHYTAVAQVSSGQYYSFDDSCVRPISLNNVLSTNAYIMIFEMENYSQNQQIAKMNGTTVAKTVPTSLSNSTNKPPVSRASTSAGCSNGSSSGLLNNLSNSSKTTLIGPQLPPQRSIELNLPVQKSNDAISTQLSQKTQEKSQPRLVVHNKNGKVLNGNSLVPYDAGSSEEEDNCSSESGTSKNQTSNTASRINVTNGVPKCLLAKDVTKTISNSKELQKTNSKSNTNGVSTTTMQVTIVDCTKNGSNSNGRISVLKHQNGKTDTNGQSEQRDKEWRQTVRIKNGQEETVSTKATTNNVKSWQAKDRGDFTPSGSSSNGWSHSETSNSTPSAAAVRNFNGTNRSDTVSHLMKMSHRGYGSSSVTNWNGNRTQLDRDVDNDRREERKRHFNADDEEIDKGRTKKVKDYTNRRYEDRSSYNSFQGHQNKTWNRFNFNHPRRQHYNTSYPRSRHGNNYRPSRYRFHPRYHL
ncbi:ubiquitin carboxyl-terminal hydrolase 36-like isoform X1 [Temnothorax curvispinosus]|uniref:Ubiquitin carboxyl-terminal hydrolase n=1 Tax=Temnothorax curvispinosus TaxID=300111 RepID=A0A6J1R4Y2_9HYME|nr:ubiquitin carboxyl-terminal hydrolase 36-like isoform X1 [Temnothorax curvispinosus]XP_024889254.1 ubiquitin carboxyl-terminal hydrolase 36-like isoform X1 [Temnothorax curvispinosus]XP_024889261.1 ubiquitin carboxyl-terminal hydrolase 36-like isoform X1 [Temnothorax curvispinosus]